MWFRPRTDSEAVISALFCELFTAVNALQALNEAGLEDSDLELIGVLAGGIPDLTGFLSKTGVPGEHAAYYQTCFEDGGVLILVHARQPALQKKALAVLKEQGGTVAPSSSPYPLPKHQPAAKQSNRGVL